MGNKLAWVLEWLNGIGNKNGTTRKNAAAFCILNSKQVFFFSQLAAHNHFYFVCVLSFQLDWPGQRNSMPALTQRQASGSLVNASFNCLYIIFPSVLGAQPGRQLRCTNNPLKEMLPMNFRWLHLNAHSLFLRPAVVWTTGNLPLHWKLESQWPGNESIILAQLCSLTFIPNSWYPPCTILWQKSSFC